jgi:alanine racemase
MGVPIPFRSSWVEIDLAAIESNARRLKQLIGPEVELMGMVKANAYGHGATGVAPAAVRGGASWLGVYTVGEGVEVRRTGVQVPILVLGPTPPEWLPAAAERDLALTTPSADSARALAQTARSLGKLVRVHVKVNTGMNRLGVEPEEAVPLIRELREGGGVEVEGLATHFAVADDPNARGIAGWGAEYTRRQFESFRNVVEQLEAEGLGVRYYHAANSPATLYRPEYRLNIVRTGITLYGLHPSAEAPRPSGFQPALTWKTRLALVRRVPKGSFVSYGATFETQRDSLIGVIMAGYADGFRRGARNYGEVLICGKRAPLVGRVCMDQTMVDVTDIPGAEADAEVVIIGKQGEQEIPAEEVGQKAGTNNYEVVTTISARIPRVYK